MAQAIHVTQLAAERYVERVNPYLTLEEAAEAIRRHTPACCAAAGFGAKIVITSEARLLLDGLNVVTVLHKKQRTPNWAHLS